MSDTLKITLDAAKRIAARVEELQVKELAAVLGVHRNYVYQMRQCGFVMRGKNNYAQTATEIEARQWIVDNNFHVVKGKGVKSSGGGVKS